jgi:1,2-diacylglycerol 3-beta-galactosyltransferase
VKKRILILMSDTGGGHRAAAEAIRDALYVRYGQAAVNVELVDVFRDYSPVPLKYMPELYPWWVNNSKSSWGVGYNFSNTRRRARILSTTVYHTIENGLKRMFREHPSDVVVSVHSVVSGPALRTLSRMPYRPPFMIVVTDLVSTHHLWYDRRTERCLVPSEPAYQRGLESGLRPDQLRVTGLPVHPDFISRLKAPADARAQLGWDPDLPAVVLVGGGDGMGPVYRTAQTINERRLRCQLIVIAGRNATLRRQLESIRWNQPTLIYGFRTDMPVILAATDVLVTKAGPATITEACIAGVPVILYDAIPGQETGNVEFVVRNNIGVFAPTPEEIGSTLARWLNEGPDKLRQRAQRARDLGRPDAVFDIAEEIWHYAHSAPIETRRTTLWKNVVESTRSFTKEL